MAIEGVPNFIAISKQEFAKSKGLESQMKALMSGKPADISKLLGGDQTWVHSFDHLMSSWMSFGSVDEIMKGLPKPGDLAKAAKSLPISELAAAPPIDISSALPPGMKMPKLK